MSFTLADLSTPEGQTKIAARLLANLGAAGQPTGSWAPSSVGGVENLRIVTRSSPPPPNPNTNIKPQTGLRGGRSSSSPSPRRTPGLTGGDTAARERGRGGSSPSTAAGAARVAAPPGGGNVVSALPWSWSTGACADAARCPSRPIRSSARPTRRWTTECPIKALNRDFSPPGKAFNGPGR
jgi:hypothetical protein